MGLFCQGRGSCLNWSGREDLNLRPQRPDIANGTIIQTIYIYFDGRLELEFRVQFLEA